MKLCDEYARATEWNLVTLAGMAGLKSISHYRLTRQITIASQMVSVSAKHEKSIDWGVIHSRMYPHLEAILKEQKRTDKPIGVLVSDFAYGIGRNKRR